MKFLRLLLDFFFPEDCLHCKANRLGPLCAHCLNHVIFLDSEGVNAATVPYEGSMKAYLNAFRYNKRVEFAKGIASLMVIQFNRLGWALPDAIIPAPLHPVDRLERGFHSNLLLAKEVSKMLTCPLIHCLRTHISSNGELSVHLKYFARKNRIYEKRILLISETKLMKSHLEECRTQLADYFPKQIEVLSFTD